MTKKVLEREREREREREHFCMVKMTYKMQILAFQYVREFREFNDLLFQSNKEIMRCQPAQLCLVLVWVVIIKRFKGTVRINVTWNIRLYQ